MVRMHSPAASQSLNPRRTDDPCRDHRRTIGDLQGLAEGVKYVAKFLRQARVPPDDERWAFVRIRWSYVNRMSGRQKAALRHARRARRMLTLDEHLGLYAQATLAEGLAVKFVYDHRTAVPVIQDALAAAVRCDDRATELETRRLLAAVLRESGDIEASAGQYGALQKLIKGEWMKELPQARQQFLRANYLMECTQQAWLAGEAEAALYGPC